MATMIKFVTVSKSFNNQLLYKNATFKILEGEKVLLCGANGAGKTTLIGMILGEIDPNDGTIWLDPNIVIANLTQLEGWGNHDTVGLYIDTIFDEITSIQKKLRELEVVINQSYSDQIAKEYANIYAAFELLGGYAHLNKKEEFLQLFGLSEILDRTISTLSGGEQQYLRLATVLFSRANLLILDEPFTFLDQTKTRWILDYLKNSDKTVIVISHNFYLVRQFATSIIYINDWQIKKYPKDYDAFIVENGLEESHIVQMNTSLDHDIKKREASIEQRKEWMKKAFKKKRHAVMIRRLERDIVHAQKSKHRKKEVDQSNLSALLPDNIEEDTPELLIRLENIGISFDDRGSLFTHITLNIYSHQRYLILGDNGVGKSTLLNIIMKKITPSHGRVIYTRKITIASLSQLHLDSNPTMRSLDLLMTYSSYTKDDWINNYPAYFTDDFLDKRLSSLSGGELTKLYIFIALLQDFDLLILDEPTTFIDVYYKKSIIDLLNACQKSLLIVSHDPDLVTEFSGMKLFLHNQSIDLEAVRSV